MPDDSAVAALGIYPKKMKSIPTKMSIVVLFITDKSLEATKISFHKWKVKESVVHANNGILFNAREMNYQAMKRYGYKYLINIWF